MKKTNFYLASAIIIFGLLACNGNQTTTSGTDSTTQTTTNNQMNPGDSAVTTTTTTTISHHRYTGSFTPQPNVKYIDLRMHKEITVKIDTEKGQIVNSETNEPVDLFVMPTTHDTIYGQTGTVVNNYIIKDASGDYSVDTTRLSTTDGTTNTAVAPDGNYKEKDKNNKTKIKTGDYKIKEKDGETKVKDR